MCGIFGVIDPSNKIKLNAYKEKIEASMNHRGPDGGAWWTAKEGNIHLLHKRLSIIDLESGNQPMIFGPYVIVFNGEIFNYQEIRKEIETNFDYSFRTNSDTEVLLASYIHWGRACLKKFRGMFAFSIYNENQRSLFCARDTFGIKPFFYSQLKEGGFVFASEIKSIRALDFIKWIPNSSNFDEFIVFGYTAGEETLTKNIKQLKPGHFLEIDFHGQIHCDKFTNPEYTPPSNFNINDLQEKIKDAVKYWCTADVNIATLLSGGVDSSTIAAHLRNLKPNDKYFSAFFPGDDYSDERYEVDIVKNHLELNVTSLPLEQNYIAKNLYRLIEHNDEPIPDGNFYTLMALCEAIREQSNIKVLLCGEGADEIFAGYERYASIPQKFLQTKNQNDLIYGYNYVGLERLKRLKNFRDFENKARFQLNSDINFDDPTNAMLKIDQNNFLQMYLARQDKIGMMFGFEIRTPFLDQPLVQYVNSLPSSVKIKDNWHKWCLRKASETLLPNQIIWKKNKTAFSAPIKAFLKQGFLADIFKKNLIENKSSVISEIYSLPAIKSMYEEHCENITDHSNTLWRLLALELWLEVY